MWYEDAKERLAKHKFINCDGVMWDEEPSDRECEEVHDYWSRITWDKFEHLPIVEVQEIIDDYADLRDLLDKKDATIADAYDRICEVENWTFDDVKQLNDQN